MPIIVYKNGRFGARLHGGQYDGEKIPGDLDQWNVLSADSNELLSATYGYLSERSITLYHTYPLVRAAINKQIEYAIGTGLVFRSQPNWSMLGMDKASAKDWGKDFQKIVHYYFQKLGFYEKQAVVMRGGLASGDSLLLFLREDGNLSDLVEFGGDQIHWEYSQNNPDGSGYMLGIEHDKYFRRMGIRKYDGTTIRFRDENGDQQLVQYLSKELPRQLRGYPLAYSIINLAKNDDRHTDATTHRAVLESIIIGSTETDSSNPTRQAENFAKANLKKYQRDPNASLLSKIGNAFRLGAGNMFQFRPGEKMTFSDLKTPSNTFRDFKETIAEYVGAATGTPPEVILSKYSTSYTAHRGALNDFQKTYFRRRSNFGRTVGMAVIAEIAKDAILNRYIDAPGFFENPMRRAAYLQGTFLGPVPGAVNPVQEATAKKIAVKNAFTLRSDIAAEYGNEWDNFIDEWGAEEQEYAGLDPEQQLKRIEAQEQVGAEMNGSDNDE